MINSTGSSTRLENAMGIDLKTWPQLPPFRQPAPAEPPPRYFAVAVFVSAVTHALLAYLLWIVVSDRIAFEPEAPVIDTPLILSLSTFTSDSQDGMDLEAVPEAQPAEPPVQTSHSSSERSSSAESRSEDKPVAAPESRDVPSSESPSFEMAAASRMAWDFGISTEIDDESVVTSEGQAVSGSETPEGKSPTACLTPSSGLDRFYCMEREFGGMSEFEIQDLRIKVSMRYISKHREWLPPDCRTAYSGAGLFAIPLLIRDAITGNGCEWTPSIKINPPPVYTIDNSTADSFKTLLPVNVNDNKIIFNITKEGEIRVKGKKVNLNAIQGIMEIFRKEYPDGSVIITCDRDSLHKKAIEVRDKVRAAKVKMAVIVNLESDKLEKIR